MRTIIGWTSKQEVRASIWQSLGKIKVTQIACNSEVGG